MILNLISGVHLFKCDGDWHLWFITVVQKVTKY